MEHVVIYDRFMSAPFHVRPFCRIAIPAVPESTAPSFVLLFKRVLTVHEGLGQGFNSVQSFLSIHKEFPNVHSPTTPPDCLSLLHGSIKRQRIKKYMDYS